MYLEVFGEIESNNVKLSLSLKDLKSNNCLINVQQDGVLRFREKYDYSREETKALSRHDRSLVAEELMMKLINKIQIEPINTDKLSSDLKDLMYIENHEECIKDMIICNSNNLQIEVDKQIRNIFIINMNSIADDKFLESFKK